MSAEIELIGIVSKLKCSKPTFCAGFLDCSGQTNVPEVNELQASEGQISFSVRASVSEGQLVTLRGKFEIHTQYGKQFKAKTAMITMPATPAGIVKWLQWKITGIGAVTAQRLVDEFGINLPERMASDPEAVAIFAKLRLETVQFAAEAWANEKQKVGAFTWLAGHGLSQKQCDALLARFGGGAVQIIQEDPFQLIGRCDGFGWIIVDDLAAKVDIVGDDPRRLRGSLAAVVREQHDEGSTAVLVETACRQAADKLNIRDPKVIAGVLESAIERGDVRRYGTGTPATDYLSTPFAYECEKFTWLTLKTMAGQSNPYGYQEEDRARELAESYRSFDGLTLDDSQFEAVVKAIQYRASVITGGAGCGKSTLIKSICKFFNDGDVPIRLAAPTGKAARRLQEVTGRDAETIHRLLEYGPGGLFGRDRQFPLTNCAVIIDEMSMTDSELFYRLLLALGPGTVLVLVGDPNQLPPVGAGSPLRDVLAYNLIAATQLDRCHRQAGWLKTNCSAILEGRIEPSVTEEEPSPWRINGKAATADAIVGLVRMLYSQYLPQWGYDPIADSQFMTARHDGPLGTKRLNLVLQHLHQNKLGNTIPVPAEDAHEDRPSFYPGDKVVVDRNDYDLNVMNGELGVIVEVEPKEPETRGKKSSKPLADLIVRFGDREVVFPVGKGHLVSLAYCLTTHRLQGSQAKCAIVIVPKSHAFLQTRGWLYTSVTRAQKTAVIIGQGDAIIRAAEKETTDRRCTVTRVFATVPECAPDFDVELF